MPFVGTEFQEVPHFGPGIAPLFPVTHSNPAANPLINSRNGTVILCNSKVIDPTLNVLMRLLHPVIHGNPPAATGEFPDAPLKLFKRLIGTCAAWLHRVCNFTHLSVPSWHTVVGITAEAMTTLFQLFVQIVEYYIGKEGGKWSTLGNTERCYVKVAINNHFGSQILSNQLQYSFIIYSAGYSCHKNIMRNSIEKLCQIRIYSNLSSLLDK